MSRSHDFEVGDIVKLRTGDAYQCVKKVKDHVISTEYPNGRYKNHRRPAAHFELIQRKKKPMPTAKAKTLYKTQDDQYGTVLAKDSRNWLVLELKGGGGIKAYDPATLEEVVPYTVEIQRAESHSAHIEVDKGSVEVGDILVVNTELMRVIALDTKCRSPIELKTRPRKVGSVPI